MVRASRTMVAVVALLGVLGAGCGSDVADTGATAAAPERAAEVTGDMTVFAAASLTAAFTEIANAFEAAHPGAKITMNFAGSSDLVTQIAQGAPADVFASADETNMNKLTAAGETATRPAVFATNTLQIIVGAGNPKGITAVGDLATPTLAVVTCAPEVPCGAYATQIFDRAGVKVTPRSLEANVKAVVTKVTLGEADAGVVYRTDVRAAGKRAAGVDIPPEINVVAQYPIAVTKEATNVAGARAFIDFVTSEVGQQILSTYGFGSP